MNSIDRLLRLAEIERLGDGEEAARLDRHIAELLDIVDANGNIIDRASRLLAHRLGLRHRTCFLFLTHGDQHIIQQRGGGASGEAGRLDVPVGGHVMAGEEPLSSLLREAREELELELSPQRIREVAVYNRDPTRVDLAELNRERRYVYHAEIGGVEYRALLESDYSHEVESVLALSSRAVLEAVTSGRVADGLRASFPYFLHWRLEQVSR